MIKPKWNKCVNINQMEREKAKDLIALVDEGDRIVGYENKLKVHQDGILHRAFSVVVINSAGQWLMHRRALEKYHSGGTWTNTCCSHLTPGESMEEATQHRLLAEMGIEAHPRFIQSFHYRAEFENGLVENEIDHIYIAYWDGDPDPDPGEVMDWKWSLPEQIEEELKNKPDEFSAWFPLVYNLLKPELLDQT